MCLLRFRSPWWMLCLILLAAACSPVAVEPAAYPAVAPATATLPPYPWPTPTAGPTDPPEPTDEPPPTEPTVPTRPPTPAVTPIPTAAPPIIPLPDGTTPQPFTLFWRDGDVIRSLRSEGETEPTVFLDPAKEFALYLTPEEAYFRSWGAVSPDGRTLALVLTEEEQPAMSPDVPYPAHIYLLDRESRLLRPLVKYGADPVWSPDGKRLAYRSLETGGLRAVDFESGADNEVYTADRDEAHTVSAFSWSSDNRYLAVLDEVPFESTALQIVDSLGESLARLVVDPQSNWVSAPQWSPNSDQIAFLWGAGERSGGVQLHVVDLHGSQWQLAYGINAGGGPPRWSTDGQWIAYAGTAVNEPLPSQIDLWLTGTDEEVPRRLTFYDEKLGADNESSQETSPMWTPDGTQIVFRRSQEIWVLSLIDGGQRKLFMIPSGFDTGLVIGY